MPTPPYDNLKARDMAERLMDVTLSQWTTTPHANHQKSVKEASVISVTVRVAGRGQGRQGVASPLSKRTGRFHPHLLRFSLYPDISSSFTSRYQWQPPPPPSYNGSSNGERWAAIRETWRTKDQDVENFSSYSGRDGLPRFHAQSNCECKYEDLPTCTHPHLGFTFNLFIRIQLPLHFVMTSDDAWVLYHDESGQKEMERRLGKNGDMEFGIVQAEGGMGEMSP
ncbi:uncharacterized protein ARMOST_13598 [Armillaria ostoyae]|uniref:Uncharacterized protein n=1 Tax=Armillaria ostoyae TaxID=47428 RepID=A0A284RNC3_ARMOS|nr:uncharacterized protein ARMOST_13598 [Armillaria ostoyae]